MPLHIILSCKERAPGVRCVHPAPGHALTRVRGVAGALEDMLQAQEVLLTHGPGLLEILQRVGGGDSGIPFTPQLQMQNIWLGKKDG